MSQADIVVIGSVNTDYMVRGDRLPRPGETVQGDLFLEEAGGKGGNQSVAAARLGGRVALVSRVGADERGERLLRRLAAEGVGVDGVGRDDHAATGAALIAVDAVGEKQIIVSTGANGCLLEQHIESAAGLIRSARVLLAQFQIPIATVTRAMRIAKAAGLTTVLDPAPAAPLSDDLLGLIDVLRCNSGEAQTITGVAVDGEETARRAAHQLLRRGVGAAILQSGERGDLLVSADDELFLPRHDVESVDATGAGDAFAAAIAVTLAEGGGLPQAAALGSAAAALATTQLGAQAGLSRRADAERLAGRSS